MKDTEKLIKRFEECKKKKEQKETEKIQTETMIKSLKESYKESMEKLKEKHNVSSLKEAKEIRDKKFKTLTEELEALENGLARFEQEEGDETFAEDIE